MEDFWYTLIDYPAIVVQIVLKKKCTRGDMMKAYKIMNGTEEDH